MAKRTTTRPEQPRGESRRERAKAALEKVLDDIHDDHRLLEGEELVRAVYEVFDLVRPTSSYKDAK